MSVLWECDSLEGWVHTWKEAVAKKIDGTQQMGCCWMTTVYQVFNRPIIKHPSSWAWCRSTFPVFCFQYVFLKGRSATRICLSKMSIMFNLPPVQRVISFWVEKVYIPNTPKQYPHESKMAPMRGPLHPHYQVFSFLPIKSYSGPIMTILLLCFWTSEVSASANSICSARRWPTWLLLQASK